MIRKRKRVLALVLILLISLSLVFSGCGNSSEDIKENGEFTQGTLALQYITKYATAGIWKYYLALSAIFTVFLVGLYLLVFVKKAKGFIYAISSC